MITNQHVVSDGGDITVNLESQSPRAATLARAPASATDLAVLTHPEADGAAALTLGGAPELGQQLFVLGFPVGLAPSLGFQVRKVNVAILDARAAVRPARRRALPGPTNRRQPDTRQLPGLPWRSTMAASSALNALVAALSGTLLRRRALRRCWRTCARARSSRACRSEPPRDDAWTQDRNASAAPE